MNDAQFLQARRAFLRDGEISHELLALLAEVVHRLIRFGGLPPMYSPTGRWDEDAEEEVFADWLEARLIGTGQLAALMQRSGSVAAFARSAETYLRRHLINRLERSYASNLYGRLRELLPEDERFEVLVKSEHEQHVVWKLREQDDVGPWQEGEDRLVSLAWGLGDFEVITYREDAKKLSPVLERPELLRFVAGLLEAAQAGLTLSQMVRVLVRRFDLEPVTVEELGDESEELARSQGVIDDVDAARLARAALAELSSRQADVLREWLRGVGVREIAQGLQVSVGTVSNEQGVISAVLGRLSEPDGESRGQLLNALRDLLFLEDV